MSDLIERQAAIEECDKRGAEHIGYAISKLPYAQPEQLERCPIYGGVCGYPSDHCYECPNHHDTKVANGMALPSNQIDDSDKNFLAHRIKCALGDTGHSQRELSEMTGITQVTISRYANGLRIPSATNLKAIADALGVGVEYFFADQKLPSAQPKEVFEIGKPYPLKGYEFKIWKDAYGDDWVKIKKYQEPWEGEQDG